MQCRLRMWNTFLRLTPSKEWSFLYYQLWSGKWAPLHHFHTLTITSTSLASATHCWGLSCHESVRSFWQLWEVCGFWQTVRVPSTLLAIVIDIVIDIVILCSIFHGCECHANDKNWKFQVFVCTVTLTSVFLNVCRNNVSCISTLSDSCCSYNLFPWRSHSPTSCRSA